VSLISRLFGSRRKSDLEYLEQAKAHLLEGDIQRPLLALMKAVRTSASGRARSARCGRQTRSRGGNLSGGWRVLGCSQCVCGPSAEF
jgi:hypothetical protein